MDQGSTGVALEPTKVGGDTRNFSANGKKKKKKIRSYLKSAGELKHERETRNSN